MGCFLPGAAALIIAAAVIFRRAWCSLQSAPSCGVYHLCSQIFCFFDGRKYPVPLPSFPPSGSLAGSIPPDYCGFFVATAPLCYPPVSSPFLRLFLTHSPRNCRAVQLIAIYRNNRFTVLPFSFLSRLPPLTKPKPYPPFRPRTPPLYRPPPQRKIPLSPRSRGPYHRGRCDF